MSPSSTTALDHERLHAEVASDVGSAGLGLVQGGAQSRFAWSEAVFEPRGRSDAMG